MLRIPASERRSKCGAQKAQTFRVHCALMDRSPNAAELALGTCVQKVIGGVLPSEDGECGDATFFLVLRAPERLSAGR
jgi:hypothetical protein